MLARQVRSGLTETIHDGAVAVVGADNELIAAYGDIDRPFFIRSAAKPFQALVSQESGAGLEPLELAMACASHRGFPVQVELVRSVLERGGLHESALQCPPDWPLSPVASRLASETGLAGSPRRIWHNCSGKHAGFLRACVGAGWPIADYLDPGHPLQERLVDVVSELGDFAAGPVGVDGCGSPVLRTTARAMATLYARLATTPRLWEVFTAMHRYPALIGCNGEGDTEIAIATNCVAKGGAQGCIGVAVPGTGGIGVKSWDGLGSVANLGAAVALDQIGRLPNGPRAALEKVLRPPVMGGGREVGRLEPEFTLS
ncbi:MAG TPA: asparaginase [Acidimicrobiia bacterium]|nr:asparaginase [Acidimicrobiia bacterium]